MKKLIALFSAAAFSFALGTAFAEEGPPTVPAPTKSFSDMKQERSGKKGAKKPAEKKQPSKKKTSGKKKSGKTAK